MSGHVRAAWAHYVRRDAALAASLIGLPGAAFTATGAQSDRNSALVSAGLAARRLVVGEMNRGGMLVRLRALFVPRDASPARGDRVSYFNQSID